MARKEREAIQKKITEKRYNISKLPLSGNPFGRIHTIKKQSMIQGFRRRKSSKIIAFDKKLKKTSIIKEILKNNDPIHMNKRNSIAIVLTSKGPEKTRSSASLFQTSRT